jgi:membrane protease YdiL (CAAX protease family)
LTPRGRIACDWRVPNASPRIIGLLAAVAVVAAPLVPEISLVVLAAMVAAFAIARPVSGVHRVVAGVIPAAVYVAWGTLPQPPVPDIAWCGDILAPPVLRTVGGAAAVFAVTGLLRWRLRSSGSELGFVRPSTRLVVVSLAAALAVALGSLALGTVVAAPFFGTVELKLDDARAIIPAVVVATASGSMQEVAYRGAMLGWLTPAVGARTALLVQAIAFGASHIGTDYITSPLPVMIAVAGGGLVAGYIVQRYRSLTFVIAVHAAFDVPLYFVAACRLT